MAKNDVYSPCYCGSGKKFKFCCFEDEKSSNQFNFPAPAKTNTFQKISQRCLQSLSPHSPEANSHRSTGPETIKEIVRDFIQNNSRWSAVISKTPGLLKFAKFFNPKDVDMEFSLKLITVTYSSKLFPEIKFAIDSSGYFIAQDEQNIEAFVGLMWALFGDSKRQHSRSDDKADLIIAYIASRFNLDGFDLYKFKLGGIVLPVDGFHPSENLELSKQTHHLMKDLFSSHAKPANGIYSWNGSEVEFSDSAKFPDGAYFVFTNGDIISFSLMSRHSYQELLPPKLKKIVRDFSAKRDRGRSLLYSFGRDFVQVKTVDALPLFFDYLQKAEKSGQPNKVKTYFIARETKSVFDPSIDKVALSEITSASSLKDSALTLELKYPNVAVHLVSGTHYDACKVDHEFFYARKTQELIKLNVRGIDRVLGGSSGNRYYMPVAKLPPGVVMGGILSPAMTPRQGVESLSLINGLNQAVAGQVQFSAKEEVPSKLIHNRICFYTDKPHRLDWSLVIGDGRPPKASESAMADSSRLLTGVPPVVAQIMVLAIDGFRGLWDYLERRYYEHIETSNAKLVARHRGLGLCLAAELSALLVESTASEDEASQEDREKKLATPSTIKSPIQAPIKASANEIYLKMSTVFSLGTQEANSLDEACTKKLKELILETIESLIELIHGENHNLMLGDGALIDVNAKGVCGEFLSGFFAYFLQKKSNLFSSSQCKTLGTLENIRFMDSDPKALVLSIPDAIGVLPYLQGSQFEIFIDGRPLETLEASDFSTVFNLPEGPKGIDWFGLHPKTFFKGRELTTDVAKRFSAGSLVEFEGKFYVVPRAQIPSLKWLEYFWTKIHSGKPTSNYHKADSGIFATAQNEVLNMLAMQKAGLAVIGGARWKKIEQAFHDIDQRDIVSLAMDQNTSASLGMPLKPFQVQGVRWLEDHYNIQIGGILADDMGLGKTIQTLGLFESLRRRGELGKSLIVVPSSLIHNWLSEAKKFAPQLSVTVFDPKVLMEQRNQNLEESADQGNILLTTYGMLTEHSDRFQGSPWNVVIFDEAQNLKNIKSVRTAAARSIQACVKFALTGTPMENHYGEFYSLIDLVASGSLGTYSDFLQEYQVKLNQGARTAEMRESIEFLRLKAKPLVLRRTKDRLLLELPEKTETTLLLPFEISQKKIYRDTAISWNNRVKELISAKGEAMGQLQMLTALLRLRQVCSYPGAVPNTLYSKMPPKFESLIESLDELRERGEPAVVFTNFVTTLTALETELNNQGFFTLAMHGKTTSKRRVEILEEFDRSAGQVVLLMTQKVGGVGLNLTRASYVFHLEPWWNPAVENQATDRVHRMGQTKSVQVYRYIMEHSVEEKIQLLKNYKGQLFDALLSESEGDASTEQAAFKSAALSRADFEFLLS